MEIKTMMMMIMMKMIKKFRSNKKLKRFKNNNHQKPKTKTMMMIRTVMGMTNHLQELEEKMKIQTENKDMN